MTLSAGGERADSNRIGPFGSNTPGLGYREFLADFDSDAEMWRQIVPGQSGRGLALGRWGLHQYEEYEGQDIASYRGDPLWVPMVVEWGSLTALDGAQIVLDSGYVKEFHSTEWEFGTDSLPAVGIGAVNSTWPALCGPYSIVTPEGLWWEAMEWAGAGGPSLAMPVNHVLPIEDDEVLKAVERSISETERHWPMDNCSPSVIGAYSEWGNDIEEERERIFAWGHDPSCFKSTDLGTPQEYSELTCTWDHESGHSVPCGGGAHIAAVLDSFIDALPYERFTFDPLVVPYWDHLKRRNTLLYKHLLDIEETHQQRERTWYYSYLRQWSPWGHSSQVPGQLLVS